MIFYKSKSIIAHRDPWDLPTFAINLVGKYTNPMNPMGSLADVHAAL